jgi:hypothetical protein
MQLSFTLGRGHRLTVTRPAVLEQPRVRERADEHRLEPGVAHQFFGHPQAAIGTASFRFASRAKIV